MGEVIKIIGGFFKTNTGQYIIKNIKLYKSLQWTSGVVKIHNSVYKHLEPADLPDEKPYYIEISRFNNQQSLQCDDMIIYQQAKLFEFTLELTLAEGFKSTDILYTDILYTDILHTDILHTDILYEYVVKEL